MVATHLWRRSVSCVLFLGTIVIASAADDSVVPPQRQAARPTGSEHDALPAIEADRAHLDVRNGDSPMWGGSRLRNSIARGSGIPTRWNIGENRVTDRWVWKSPNGRRIRMPRPDWDGQPWRPPGSENIKWVAALGSQSHGTPVVANGRIYVGSNNPGLYVKRFPATIDLGALLCLREETGEFLWQHSVPKLPHAYENDSPNQGLCATPVVDGDRLWVVTNRCEVVCLDAEGFHDGENDGPWREEQNEDVNESDVVWKFDMIGELGVDPHSMSSCSLLMVGETLLICTSNGVDQSHVDIPALEAPSFLALHRDTAEVLWTDNSPGRNILHGQWASPSYAVLGGQPQVLFPGGDGWLYSFDPAGDGTGNSRLLWKFDCNPKESQYQVYGRGTRNPLVGFAAIDDGLVYIAVGDDPEHGEGDGHLWCIDPTRRTDGSDVSAQLAVDAEGRVIPPRRIQCVDTEAGERAIPNPDSAVVWHYTGQDLNRNGELEEYPEVFHRSISTPAISDDLLYACDLSGIVHCLNARTGEAHWTYDMYSMCWGSPLIVDGKVYVGNEDGSVCVFRHSPDPDVALPGGKPIAVNDLGNAVYKTPVVVNNVLYIGSRDSLYAIEASDE